MIWCHWAGMVYTWKSARKTCKWQFKRIGEWHVWPCCTSNCRLDEVDNINANESSEHGGIWVPFSLEHGSTWARPVYAQDSSARSTRFASAHEPPADEIQMSMWTSTATMSTGMYEREQGLTFKAINPNNAFRSSSHPRNVLDSRVVQRTSLIDLLCRFRKLHRTTTDQHATLYNTFTLNAQISYLPIYFDFPQYLDGNVFQFFAFRSEQDGWLWQWQGQWHHAEGDFLQCRREAPLLPATPLDTSGAS